MQTAAREEKVGDMEDHLLSIVRRVTVTIKTFPFYYAGGLILFWFVAPKLDITTTIIIDNLIVLSALMILFLIRLSYCVKLCVWHRIQCVLPILPQISTQIDQQVYEYGSYTATANTIAMILVFALSLVNAYFVFIKPAARPQRSGRSR